MRLSSSVRNGRLPRRFPVGTTYVVEGRGGEHGQLCVFSRYLLLPGGERINLASDFGPATARGRADARKTNGKSAKARSGRAKKILRRPGTSRGRHR